MRDVVGNPFRPVAIEPLWLTWNDSIIPKLSSSIYEERSLPEGTLDAARLAVLGDALEEAGCDTPEILAHCRDGGPHVRGCWMVDIILAKDL